MMRLLDRLARRSHGEIVVLGIAINSALGIVDYLIGYELAFSVFYLVGVALVAWLAGRRWAYLLSVISAGIWIAADLLAGHPYSHPLIPVWNTVVRGSFFFLGSYTLAALKQAIDQQTRLARTDPLTSILNHRTFYEEAEREITRARRYKTPLTLAYFDLDNFKAVNDRQGHQTGDTLLTTVAETLRKCLRQSDLAGRVGGDEFAVLMPQISTEQAALALPRMRRILTEAMEQRGWPVTFSIGAVTWDAPPASVDDLIGHADRLMYQVKQASKDHLHHEHVPAGDSSWHAPPSVTAR